jgi:LuxR family maltose regulon positive regulatory protein
LEVGIARCEQIGNRAIQLVGTIALARVRQAQGDVAGASVFIRTIAQTLRTHVFPSQNAVLLSAWLARLHLAQGDFSPAARWAEERQQHIEGPPEPQREAEYLTYARVLLGQGRAAAMLPLLQRLLFLAESQGRMGSKLEIFILQALGRQALGDTAGALAAIRQALVLAEPEGYIRLFVDEGALMAQLLACLREDERGGGHVSSRYRDQLLALLGDPSVPVRAEAASVAHRPRVASLVEPLRERELEVLRLIAAGCSNRAIADRLVISVSTAKWYVNELFSKLQVTSRTQAVARAREIHLL